MMTSMMMPSGTPYVEITEQPKQRGMRFRYECEGRSAGSIPGESTTADRKSWPSVHIKNYVGEGLVRVSLVSKDNPPRPHPHSLVGKDCENGICQVRISPETQMTACFSNLGIQCMKRKEVADALQERKRLRVNPFNTPDPDLQSVDIDLNIVKLCFEGFIQRGTQLQSLQPVVSNPIFDKKATCSALLRICRVDKSFGSCKGGDEVYLLCDKVQKDDISICFYHRESGWESYGEFSPTDVHRQVAIVFRTPPFENQNIREATKVMFKLKRTSDGQTSESKDFTYLPQHHDQPQLGHFSKKRPYGFQDHSQSSKALRRHILEKIPPQSAPQPPYLRPSQTPMQAQFPSEIFRGLPPTMMQTQHAQNQMMMQRPSAPNLPEDRLDQFLRSTESPYTSNVSTSPYGAAGGVNAASNQYSKSQWMPLSPPMPSSNMQLQNSQGYAPRLNAFLDNPSSMSGLGAVSSSQDLPMPSDATSLEQITPTFLAEDLGPAYPSIGSLTSVSLNFNSNTQAALDEDLSGLVRDTENLSMEEGILDQYIKQEPNTETPDLRGSSVSATLGQQAPPPATYQSGVPGLQSQALVPNPTSAALRLPDLETSIPSFDLSDQNYLVDGGTELDEFVSKGGNMG